MRSLGIVILVIGVLMTVFTGFNIITKKKVVDLGNVEINKEEKNPVYWSPVTGALLIAVGGVVLLASKKNA
jgi:hypothetical protein